MPLKSGKSRKAMGYNYDKLREEGKPKSQAMAIMLSKAGVKKKKDKKKK